MLNFTERWKQTVDIPGLLLSLGVDVEAEGLEDTPQRVAKSWEELLRGYTLDPGDILERTFEAEGKGLVMVRDIEFTSTCEHHMIPFFGRCHIGYIPNERVAGLSKLARLVDCFAQRLQIQERMVQQIADAVQEYLEPKGVIVAAKARHLCCLGRGVKRTRMEFVTTAVHGIIPLALETAIVGAF